MGNTAVRASGSMRGNAGKDVEGALIQSLRYKNDVKKLYMSDEEIKRKAQEMAPQLCREDCLRTEMQGLIGVSALPWCRSLTPLSTTDQFSGCGENLFNGTICT